MLLQDKPYAPLSYFSWWIFTLLKVYIIVVIVWDKVILALLEANIITSVAYVVEHIVIL
jgi:hypothetical protein